jgi:tRNA1Val (adenine37-N6)-methyltransferase
VANPYFQCKQFIVHQQHTSMKVCTDACLFGAWAAQQISTKNAKTILDIGTGTGLLSLMLAQVTEKSKTNITAVEIESQAAAEASSNFTLSPWKERLHLVNDSIQNYTATFTHVKHTDPPFFDVIITNPPFYEGDLKSPDANKNKASHSTELAWSTLIENVATLLMDNGSFMVLVPTLRAYTMQKLAEAQQLNLVEEVLVYNDVKHLPFRSFLHFQKNKQGLHKELIVLRNKIVIKNTDNSYSTAFTDLLKDYYLHL